MSGKLDYSSSEGHEVQEVDERGDHGADTELHRILSTRHMTMIALGSSIGMGLWLGSGGSLAKGGPAGIFLGFVLAGTMIWSVIQSIGEMAVMYPLPSAFVQWTGKFVSPAAAFALGWAYWFGYVLGIANELNGIVAVLGFWTDKVPAPAWIAIFWVINVVINIGAVTVLGEIEVVASTIKFGWIFVVIISLIVTSAGGAPNHETIGFRYWNSQPFTNGFKGFLAVMPICIFAMAGSETAGMVPGETSNPRKAVPRAVGSIWLRLTFFYILGALMVTINIDPNDPSIFGGTGQGVTSASPFVIAYRQAKLEPMAHMMNAVILISVLSSGGMAAFAGSRTAMGLAHLGMAPAIFKRADSKGRPWPGLIVTLTLGGGLAYLNVSNKTSEVFSWLSTLTSLFTLFSWGNICLAHIRFRHAWKVQGRDVNDLPWKSWTFPYAAYWGLSWCIILIVLLFYLAVWPLAGKLSAKNFFANYVSVVLMVVLYIGARIYYRGPWWVDTSTVDLDANRRFYVDREEKPAKTGIAGGVSKAVKFVLN